MAPINPVGVSHVDPQHQGSYQTPIDGYYYDNGNFDGGYPYQGRQYGLWDYLTLGLLMGVVSSICIFCAVCIYSKYQDYQYWSWYYNMVSRSDPCTFDTLGHAMKHGVGPWYSDYVTPPTPPAPMEPTFFRSLFGQAGGNYYGGTNVGCGHGGGAPVGNRGPLLYDDYNATAGEPNTGQTGIPPPQGETMAGRTRVDREPFCHHQLARD